MKISKKSTQSGQIDYNSTQMKENRGIQLSWRFQAKILKQTCEFWLFTGFSHFSTVIQHNRKHQNCKILNNSSLACKKLLKLGRKLKDTKIHIPCEFKEIWIDRFYKNQQNTTFQLWARKRTCEDHLDGILDSDWLRAQTGFETGYK